MFRKPASFFRSARFPIVFALLVSTLLAVAPDVSAEETKEPAKQNFRPVIIADGLEHPWGIAELPDGRLLVTERPGRLRIIANGELDPEPVTGFPPIFAKGQGGLMDVELHPDFAENGWIYFAYSADEGGVGHTRIMRARLKGKTLEDVEVLFSPPVDQFTKAGAHFGCRIVFDGKGHIFFPIGDRGKKEQAQDLSKAAGKIHRINEDGSIPKDNPFLETPGALPSIWAYGTRNAQGLRLHPETGDLWAVEHGPRGGDELNVIRKGANYGWPVITYGINYNGTPITDLTEAPGMEQPVIHWTPSIAVGGLEINTGKKYPGWKGDFFATALAGQKLVRMVVEGQEVKLQEPLLEKTGRIREVKAGADGTLYVLYDSPGRVIALEPVN